jgi:glycosyltransferase involved in cell wall biosynthesis
MVSAVLAAPWLPRTDVVVTTSPQFFNGLAGYFVGRIKRAPWVLEIRDLWPESILSVGAIRNRSVIRLLEWLERFAYRKADVIVPVTDAFKRYMVERGVPAEKIYVIKNGVDLAFYRSIEGPNPLAVELGLEGKFVAAYVGTHGMAHHLETVLEAARQLRERRDIVFLMAGDGAERDRLVAQKEAMGLENVLMLGQQPKARMPELWALTGASLVLLKRSDTFKTVIPSKIFESMAMKRPIVLGVEGESRELVASAEAGVFIEPENAAELARAVVRLADDGALRGRLGANGRRFVEQHFDRRVLARRYVEVFHQRLGKGAKVPDRKDATVEAGPGVEPARRPPGEV